MFGKKPNNPVPEQPSAPVSIETMPTAFYGGKDPVIYADSVPVERPHAPKPVPPKPPAPPKPGLPQQQMQTHASRWLYITIGVVIVLLGAGGAAWFMLGNTPAPAEEQTVITPPVFETPSEPAPEPEPIVSATSTEPAPQSPTSLGPVALEFPRVLLSDSTDGDTDALTDEEEEGFGTDPAVWDTDADGYYDGQEIFNLYNPTGFAPVKLIDSGLVKEYANPIWQYRVYYPVNWVVGSVDLNNDQVLISSVSGDYIEIRAMQKQGQETFFEWFAREASTESITDIQQGKNRFEEAVWKRKDNLVGYVERDSTVYVILYHPTSDGPVAYRHVMQMMLQSFRPGKTIIGLPDQPVLPTPPSGIPSSDNAGDVNGTLPAAL